MKQAKLSWLEVQYNRCDPSLQLLIRAAMVLIPLAILACASWVCK